MKLKTLFITIIIATLLVACKGNGQDMNTSKEERIVYENSVVKTIETQLEGLKMDEIRAKAPLIMEKSISELQKSIADGELTYTELTAFYLDRIMKYDKSKNGLNAIVEINPKAIEKAKLLDKNREEINNAMYGIPILLKDNINTSDMPTSAGTYAMKDFVPRVDAEFVKKLREKNAIILGKANLSELANYMDFGMPSGYSSKLGQTHNPFDPLNISPSGSSSGSAVGVAANLSAAAFGTETTGSIISPANINSIVGFKPSKDFISTEGVVPLSSTMDTVGPMTKNVSDAVELFNATINDNSKTIKLNTDTNNLEGARIGVPKDNEKLVKALKDAGAVVVEVELKEMDNEFIFTNDFARDFKNYAEKYSAPIKSLEDLVEFNEKDMKRRAKYGQGLVEDAADSKADSDKKVSDTVKETREYIDKIIKDNKLDAIAFIGDVNVVQPCVAGYPMIAVPFGQNEYNEPTGVTFTSTHGDDQKLVNLAYSFESKTQNRLIPEKYLEKNK